MERIRICIISLMLAATAFFPVISGCSGAGTPPAPQPVLDLSKHRDPLTNRVEPVLSDRATADPVGSVPTDFDYREVDSPCVVEDPSRVPIFADRFLLFYEGTDALLNYVIALVSSTEEDLDPLVIGRTVVMGPASMPDLIDNGTPIAPFGAADPTVIVDHSRVPLESTHSASRVRFSPARRRTVSPGRHRSSVPAWNRALCSERWSVSQIPVCSRLTSPPTLSGWRSRSNAPMAVR